MKSWALKLPKEIEMSKRETKSPSPEKEVELLKDVMDQGYKIRVYDLVMGKARTLLDKLAAEFLAMARTPFSPEELVRRLNYYETVTKSLQNLMITGCYWGEKGIRKDMGEMS